MPNDVNQNEKFTIDEMQKAKRLLEAMEQLEGAEFTKKDKENI